MESGYRDICMNVTPQSIWIHCGLDYLLFELLRTCWSEMIIGTKLDNIS